MLAEALEAEVRDYVEAAKAERNEQGHALVTRNGYAREREVLCGAGSVEVKAPRLNDKRVDENGERKRFKSVIVPPYMRRSPKVTEVLPVYGTFIYSCATLSYSFLVERMLREGDRLSCSCTLSVLSATDGQARARV